MCGIAGIVTSGDGETIDRAVVSAMTDSLRHRGPDQGGIFQDAAGVALGHRRLSIIDLASGAQPMFNEDRSVVVVYNGEIYNYPDLMRELIGRGHHFASRCDTEVIVHAWEEWGERCVERFRGMFAFAIWDRNKDVVFLARDRLGIKPLYYGFTKTKDFIFGSELKALLQHPGFDRTLEPQAVEDYFAYGYIPEPKSIFRAAYKLPPGCTMLLPRRTLAPKLTIYWDVPFTPAAGPPRAEQDLEHELIERLHEAVRIRLRSDVPLGAFLSGGVDSGSVVAMMSDQFPGSIRTFSIGFSEPEWDERPYAESVAKRYRCMHRSEEVRTNYFDLFPVLSRLYDEPFADSSALPTYVLSRLTRENVTVALSGDGGDELFGGYRSYHLHMRKEAVRAMLPEALRRPLFSLLAALYPKADWAPRILRAKRTFETLAADSLGSFAAGNMITTPAERRALYSTEQRRALQGYNAIEVLRGHAAAAPVEHPLSLVQYLDMKVYLPADILTKVDRASMAHALEVRVPLLDHPFVEWVSSLPPEMKLRGAASKYIFKQAMRRYLDPPILSRKKMGFSIPLSSWLRAHLRANPAALNRGSALNESGIIDPFRVQRIIREHDRGLREHGSLLWALLMFNGFLEQLSGEAELGSGAAYAAEVEAA